MILVGECRARRCPVRLGTARGRRLEVAEGLRAGKAVVAVPPAFLAEGQAVLVAPNPAALATLARPD